MSVVDDVIRRIMRAAILESPIPLRFKSWVSKRDLEEYVESVVALMSEEAKLRLLKFTWECSEDLFSRYTRDFFLSKLKGVERERDVMKAIEEMGMGTFEGV